MVSNLGVWDLPSPGHKSAPEKFRGSPKKVKDFLCHYEKLLVKCNVTADQQRCEAILPYCSRKVAELIEALLSYEQHSWLELYANIYKYFNGDQDVKRYKVKDLVDFVQKSRKKPIRDLSDWKKLLRRYTRIGRWLRLKLKITNNEYATYLWNLINHTLCEKVEQCLLAPNPTRDMALPFAAAEVICAVEAILQRDRFDTNLVDSEADDDSITESDTDTSEDDSSFSKDDSDRERKKRQPRGKGKKKKFSTHKLTKKMRVTADSADEVDDSKPSREDCCEQK